MYILKLFIFGQRETGPKEQYVLNSALWQRNNVSVYLRATMVQTFETLNTFNLVMMSLLYRVVSSYARDFSVMYFSLFFISLM